MIPPISRFNYGARCGTRPPASDPAAPSCLDYALLGESAQLTHSTQPKIPPPSGSSWRRAAHHGHHVPAQHQIEPRRHIHRHALQLPRQRSPRLHDLPAFLSSLGFAPSTTCTPRGTPALSMGACTETPRWLARALANTGDGPPGVRTHVGDQRRAIVLDGDKPAVWLRESVECGHLIGR